MINQNPRLIRNTLNSFLFFRSPIKYADTPERSKNVGAQKCVIHLVKKSIGVVVVRSVGLCVIEVVRGAQTAGIGNFVIDLTQNVTSGRWSVAGSDELAGVSSTKQRPIRQWHQRKNPGN